MNKYLDREDIMQENRNKMYVIVIGYCSPSLQLTIKGGTKYISKSKVFNVMWMIK